MLASPLLSILALGVTSVFGYDPTRTDNLVVYYGQNSYGAVGGAQSGWQQQIGAYCQDDVINVLPSKPLFSFPQTLADFLTVAFIDVFFGTGGLPDLNMANVCNSADNGVFPGTGLANCQFLASQIQACQAAGKLVTLSLGGASGAAVLTSDAQGVQFANTIWNLFLGGSSSTRPFGAAVLDGQVTILVLTELSIFTIIRIDLDIEGGGPTGFAAFVTQIRTLSANASKKYYITGAPQCPYPDAYMGSILNAVGFDAVYVQFYNNYWQFCCQLWERKLVQNWNFASWDTWAKTVSPNKNVKVFIGAPASSSAGSGYANAATLGALAVSTRAKYSSFGGVMLWDASQAYANGRFDRAVKNIITTAGGGGVSTSKTASSSSSTKSSTPITSSTRSSTTISTTISTTKSSSNGNCAGVAAWVSTVAYVGGSQVTYNGHLWQAKYWSQADVPGGVAGDWTDLGACTSLMATLKADAPAKPTAAVLTGVAPAAKATVAAQETRKKSRAFKFV
ncbi:Glycoside hydrolase [Mycena indigotica]|uniref:Glycoside hydrolase n=1 Tax=Mycena indigotica TaxID=2126181 RepID=A0A8H6T748_9AGAR|nr:Glycoside hydrolase [Mycena indigotica]KAF7312135.1 Glycoside hydrolase [Mycena indigotica]